MLRIRVRINFGQLDPDPDPHWEGGPKLPTKVKKLQVLKCQMFFLRDEDFCWGFLYGGLGISKLQFLIKKIFCFSSVNLVIKTLDLDPDPYSDPH